MHVKAEPGIVEWKANVALVLLVRVAGPLSMMVSGAGSGGAVVTETVLLGADRLPAPSCASTA